MGRGALWAALLLTCATAQGEDFFQVRDENPLLRGFYRPLPTDLNPAAGAAVTAALSITNTVNVEQRPSGSLTVDGESDALRLSFEDALNPHWRYRITLPVIHDSGGFLDSTVADYHRVFGLPQGNRPYYPNNQLLYLYSGRRSSLALTESATSIGDLSGDLGWFAHADERTSLSLWGGVKAPTGSTERLTSDGAWDAALWAHAAAHLKHWSFAAEAGLIEPFGDQLFGGDAHTASGFGRLAVTRTVGSSWSLRAQLDGQTRRVEHNDLRLLGPSLQLSIGAAARMTRHWRVDFGFIEDAAVNTAPDITFFLGVRRQSSAE